MVKNPADLERLYIQFKEKAEAISAQVYRAKDIKEAGVLLANMVAEKAIKKIVAASSTMVDQCLSNINLKTEVHTKDLYSHAENACMGLSEMEMAIAETGSLQQDATDLDKRLVSTLPPLHVVLVKTKSLVSNLREALAIIDVNKETMPGYIAFITGPSRTGDIELVLTVGVHGPAELKIVFVDDAEGDVR